MGSGRGRSDGAKLEGDNKRGGEVSGWRVLNLSVRVMEGCVGSAVRKLFCPVNFLTTLPRHPPITLTLRFLLIYIYIKLPIDH